MMDAPHHDTIDIEQLNENYTYWLSRVTSDGLHNKSDICAVLGWYRERIRALEAGIEREAAYCDELFDISSRYGNMDVAHSKKALASRLRALLEPQA